MSSVKEPYKHWAKILYAFILSMGKKKSNQKRGSEPPKKSLKEEM